MLVNTIIVEAVWLNGGSVYNVGLSNSPCGVSTERPWWMVLFGLN